MAVYYAELRHERLYLFPEDMIGEGGEACVYAIPSRPTLVAKIYRHPSEAYLDKLRVMLDYPPVDPMRAEGFFSIAWPVDLLYQEDIGQYVGFLMPRVTNAYPVCNFYNPAARLKQCPAFNYRYLMITARNLAAVVHALHKSGYVIGDLNESNILVSNTAMVTIVDTDSFQVRDEKRGLVYRSPVGKAEYTPPELIGQNFGQIDRAPEHDCFALGVLLFQLLMAGFHPFIGCYREREQTLDLQGRIAAGHFPYAQQRRVPCEPSPLAPKFSLLPGPLKQLFLLCFEDGHQHPELRPSAKTWVAALTDAEETLHACAANTQHFYSRYTSQCPWCLQKQQTGGEDPFPLPPSPPPRLQVKEEALEQEEATHASWFRKLWRGHKTGRK